jgi:hypothetical protein
MLQHIIPESPEYRGLTVNWYRLLVYTSSGRTSVFHLELEVGLIVARWLLNRGDCIGRFHCIYENGWKLTYFTIIPFQRQIILYFAKCIVFADRNISITGIAVHGKYHEDSTVRFICTAERMIWSPCRGHLSYKATFSLSQGWPLIKGLTVYQSIDRCVCVCVCCLNNYKWRTTTVKPSSLLRRFCISVMKILTYVWLRYNRQIKLRHTFFICKTKAIIWT